MNETEVEFAADDESNFVGVGWISVEKNDGKKSYTGNFLPKVKYAEPSEEYTTKGENIEYKTHRLQEGHWQKTMESGSM